MDITWLLDIVRAGGAASGFIFALMWWLERSERVGLRKERDALLERVLTVINSVQSAVLAAAKTGEETKGILDSLTRVGSTTRRRR